MYLYRIDQSPKDPDRPNADIWRVVVSGTTATDPQRACEAQVPKGTLGPIKLACNDPLVVVNVWRNDAEHLSKGFKMTVNYEPLGSATIQADSLLDDNWVDYFDPMPLSTTKPNIVGPW
ncbi:MAG: hypothetical protein M1833_002914 [Piccolia ochrophora]|nr:MAG: hypothetical protein M1833_002914 [Piccolia ochrophora]